MMYPSKFGDNSQIATAFTLNHVDANVDAD